MKTKTFCILILLLLVVTSIEAQCAMCRAVLESEEGQQTAKGVNNGIVYLMVIPYILIGLVGYLIYRNFKKTPIDKMKK